MDIEKISSIIKTKRKEKGLTQEELANKINVTEKAISRWETGRGTPDISLLVPLSKELGISVSEILKGKENIKEDKNIKEIVYYIDKTKKEKDNHVITIATIIYGFLLLLYLYYLRVNYDLDTFNISYLGELMYNAFFISSVFLTNRYIANYYFDTIEDRERMNKISYIMIFVIYLVMVFNMTIFARNFNVYDHNIVPFKTLIKYWTYPDVYNIVVNVIGNIIIFMPVQFLIIKIFNIKEFSKCFLIDVILVILIEIIQLLSFTGVFDIDDIILNLTGMSIMYILVNGKHKLISKYKIFIITSMISSIIVLFLFYNLSIYNFGDIPTRIALLRLVISFVIIESAIYLVYKLIKGKRTYLKM